MGDQLQLSYRDTVPEPVPPRSTPTPPQRLWSVKQLVVEVQRKLEREFIDVRVEGEITNLRDGGTSGHAYFTLREDDAQISVVMFRTRARLLRFRLQNGLHVLLRGRVTVYESRGQLQIVADSAEPVGDGALRLAYEQLAEKLRAEGLFDRPRRALPEFPRCIGVITSPQGAVIHDMWRILSRRFAGSRVLLYPAAVQGQGAPQEIITGLRWFSSHPEAAQVVVLARGGGSLEDLAAFNDEGLARAISLCQFPVVTAVGHETDFTIADHVADLRAPTPSAAAEMLTAHQHQVAERTHLLAMRLQRAARYRAGMAREQLSRLLASRGLTSALEFIYRRQQRMDDLVQRMAQAQRFKLQGAQQRIGNLRMRLAARDMEQRLRRERTHLRYTDAQLSRAVATRIAAARQVLAQCSARLAALSPQAVLQRGYALVYTADGTLLRSATAVAAGDVVTTRLHDGGFTSRIFEKDGETA